MDLVKLVHHNFKFHGLYGYVYNQSVKVLRKYFNQYIEFAIIERIESIILAPWCSG